MRAFQKAPGLKWLMLGFGAYLLWYFLPSGLVAALSAIKPQWREGAIVFFSNFGSPLSALVALGIFLLLNGKYRIIFEWFPRVRSFYQYGAAGCFGFLFSGAVSLALTLLPLPEAFVVEYNQAVGQSLGGEWAFTLLLTGILAPVAEELLFRGILLQSFGKVLPFWAANGLGALLFGLAHRQLLWSVYAFAAGVIFGVFVKKTGSLAISIAAHIGFNMAGLLLSLLPDFLTAYRPLGYAVLLLFGVGAVLFAKGSLLPCKKGRDQHG